MTPGILLGFLLLWLLGAPIAWAKRAETCNGLSLRVTTASHEKDIKAEMTALKALGANCVLLKVSEYQMHYDATLIYPDPHATVPYVQLANSITLAHRQNLKVVLMPIVILEKPQDGHWRGTIAPKDFKQWQTSYRYFISKYARLAHTHKVWALAIGSEYNSLEHREQFWRDTVAEVKNLYAGQILYSANWDFEKAPAWWAALDIIGFTAYVSAGNRNISPLDDLNAEIKVYRDKFQRATKHLSLPWLITELGYPSRHNALKDPWNHNHVGLPEQHLQAQAIAQSIKHFDGAKGNMGIMIYEWHAPDSDFDISYTPKGKAAEKVIRQWLKP